MTDKKNPAEPTPPTPASQPTPAPVGTLPEEDQTAQHMADFDAWLTMRKLMIVPQVSNHVVPFGDMGQGVMITSVWRLMRTG